MSFIAYTTIIGIVFLVWGISAGILIARKSIDEENSEKGIYPPGWEP